MAGSLNRVTLVGNVGKDPETKSFSNGGKVVNFSIATSERWKDRNTGEAKEKTEWHNVAVFQDGLTDIASKYLRKGSKVMVEGKMQTRKWQDQSGNDRYSTEVVLQGFDARILLLDGKDQNSGGGSGYEPRQPAATGRVESGSNQAGYRAPARDELDDDVPF